MTSFWDSVRAEGHACGRQHETTNGFLKGEVGAIQGVFPALMYFQSGPKIWRFEGKAGVKHLCRVHYITHYSEDTLNKTSMIHPDRFHPVTDASFKMLFVVIHTRVSALLAETVLRRQSG